MKILIIGENNLNSLERIYKNNFLKLNCEEVKIISILKPKNFFFKKILNFHEKFFYFLYCLFQNLFLIRKLKNDKRYYDLVIVFNGYDLFKNTIKNIKGKSLNSTINIQTDNIFIKKNFLKENLKLFDRIYIWSKEIQKKINKNLKIEKKKIFFLPFAFDQSLSKYVKLKKINKKILFYGSWDEDRENLLKKIDHKILKIFGNGWENAKRSFKNKYEIKKELLGKKLVNEISQSLICLNILRFQAKNFINMRAFEVIGYGGTLLSEYSKEHFLFFKNYSDMIYFRHIKEIDSIYKRILSKKKRLIEIRKKNINKIKKNDYLSRAKFILKNEKIYSNK